MATKSVSIVTGGNNNATVTASEINALATDFIADGVVGAISLNTGSGGTGSFAVNAQGTPDMTVRVSAGQLYVAATPSGGTSQRVRVSMDTYEDVTISANATGSTRYDFVYAVVSASLLANPGANKDDVVTLTTSRSTSSATDNGTPPTYGYLLAVVTVSNGASSITNSNITDKRIQTGPSALKGDVTFTQTAASSDAKITAAGTDSNIHMSLTPKGNGLVKLGVLRQDDTTNTYQKGNSVMLTGWGVMAPGAANSVAETVTFGVTFAAKPIVIITCGGDAASSTTYGDGGNNVKSVNVATAYSITTTNFIARVGTRDSTNWAAPNTVFYQWMAIGELA